jgi:hypothetical protein
MGVSPPTVVFLSRAARLVGATCILVWLIAGGINLLGAADSASTSTPDLFSMLEPTVILYLLPGLVLFAMGALVKSGRLWPAPIILLISILSLFKLVLLLLPMRGAIFNSPLSCELPARIACALLCLPCVFAWEDLAEMNRTRARRRPYARITDSTKYFPPSTWPAPRPPPPARTKRPPIRPEDPPRSQTPWS